MNIPVYVTRKTANGITGNWSVNTYVATLIILVVAINFFGWAAYGIYELAIKVV